MEKKIEFFDGFSTVGRCLLTAEGSPHTVQELLDDMDRYGIEQALVIDSLSREQHPSLGNERILETVADYPRIHPAWALMPHGAGEERYPPDEIVELLRHNQVGAVFLFPVQYNFSLRGWVVDAYLEPLASAAVPIFINYNDSRKKAMDSCRWDELVELCRRFPTLPIVLSEYRIRRTNRMLYKALDTCSNLHLDLSCYWLYRGIEYLVKNWGAERLIFAGNWPCLNHACTAASVSMADIKPVDKRLIAAGNLRRLINWCRPQYPKVTLPEPRDAYQRFAQTGIRPPNLTFLDCHGHLGGYSPDYHIPDSSVDKTVKEMDRMGVERVFAFSFTVVNSDECFGNDEVAAAVARYPERFIGFAGINLHRGHESILSELQRCSNMGLCGIKLIPQYQKFPSRDPLIELCCKWADENGWFILNHGWGAPDDLESLLNKYKSAFFLTGHADFSCAPLAKKYDNLWVCTCPVHRPRDIERLVGTAGADRVMFGSDLQDLPISWGLGPVLQSELSEDNKNKILHQNMKKLLESRRCTQTF